MNIATPSNSEKDNVSKAAGIVGFFTLLSRILGLVRDMIVANFFGAGMAADAFYVAFRIPNLLRRLFAEGSLTIAFIPIFTEYLRKKNQKDAFELVRVVLTVLSLILAVVTILGILFAPWIVRIQAWGFGGFGVKYELTVVLTRITFPYIFLVSIVALFMGVLNSLKHFAAPAAAPIFLNVGIIGATLWISPHLSQPIIGTAVGILIGGCLQVFLQIPWLLKQGISLFPRWIPNHPAVKRIGLFMLPSVFGSAVYQFNQFIGTLLASFLVEGSVSWLYYADRVVQFPLGVFALAVSTAALPSLSRQAVEKDLNGFMETINHSLRITFFITIPAMVGLIVLRTPLVQLFFERGAFDSNAAEMTAYALMFYSTGLWAVSGMRILVSAFYAMQDTKTPVKIAFVCLIVNILLSIMLMVPMEHAGLALALSLSSFFQLILLVFFLRLRIEQWHPQQLMGPVLKYVMASIGMGITVYFLYAWWLHLEIAPGTGGFLAGVMGIVLFGVIIYFGMARILGCQEVSSILSSLRIRLSSLRDV
ncbi:MAG: murein biosynthesis integral membrane protein MurJ [Deltaproteobacteria bacterium]|nr:murein biosynthesis integral membrane protein MurJ [Deltaproteobacteria bacterium]